MGISPGNTPSCKKQDSCELAAGPSGQCSAPAGSHLPVDDGVYAHQRVLRGRLRTVLGPATAVHHSIATCWVTGRAALVAYCSLSDPRKPRG